MTDEHHCLNARVCPTNQVEKLPMELDFTLAYRVVLSTFAFLYLADTFIKAYLQCIQDIMCSHTHNLSMHIVMLYINTFFSNSYGNCVGNIATFVSPVTQCISVS